MKIWDPSVPGKTLNPPQNASPRNHFSYLRQAGRGLCPYRQDLGTSSPMFLESCPPVMSPHSVALLALP